MGVQLSVFIALIMCLVSENVIYPSFISKLNRPISPVSNNDYNQFAMLASFTSMIILIVLIVICAEICKKGGSGFHDFENEDAAIDNQTREFNMFPPTENTPDFVAGNSIYFEPLPDLSAKLNSTVKNSDMLRPKIVSLTEANLSEKNSNQEKIRFQSIIARNQMSREKLNFVKEMGKSWFGTVLQGDGTDLLPGYRKSKVVIQMLKEESDSHDQLTFILEASPYREIQHENILRLYGQCVETTPYLLVLEFCTFGDLKTYLVGHKVAVDNFNEKGLLLKFACDIAAGLQVLHQHKFVHRDLATRNCLLSSELICKIGDYAISEHLNEGDYYSDSTGSKIPIRWLAPELLTIKTDGTIHLSNATMESNIWTFGIVLWEILQFGELPFGSLSDDLVLKHVFNDKNVVLPKPSMQITHIDKLYDLMKICWQLNFNDRPSLRELRIMLLQLLSTKSNVNDDSFDEKWNKLMPKPKAQIVDVKKLEENVEVFKSNNETNLKENVKVIKNTTPSSSSDSDVVVLESDKNFKNSLQNSYSSKLDEKKFADMLNTVGQLSFDGSSESMNSEDKIEERVDIIRGQPDGGFEESIIDKNSKHIVDDIMQEILQRVLSS